MAASGHASAVSLSLQGTVLCCLKCSFHSSQDLRDFTGSSARSFGSRRLCMVVKCWHVIKCWCNVRKYRKLLSVVVGVGCFFLK